MSLLLIALVPSFVFASLGCSTLQLPVKIYLSLSGTFHRHCKRQAVRNRSQKASGGGSSLIQFRDKWAPGCHREGKSPNNELICKLLYVTLYSTRRKQNIFWTTVTGSHKTMLANKDNSCSIVYIYSLLCVFVSQYSSKVDDY